MKKYFIFAGAALVAMASCSKISTIEMTPAGDSPVDFSAYTKMSVTKGTIVTGTEVDSIGVFAFKQDNNNGVPVYFNTHKFATPGFMNNQKVKKGSDGKWSYSPIKYWPNSKGDLVSFFAYAPYDADMSWDAMGIKTDANGTKMEVSFPIYDDVKDQVDYLWADPQINKGNKSAGGSVTVAGADSVISFAFSHITSQLSLYLGVEQNKTEKKPTIWDDPNTEITIESIEFKGMGDKISLKYTIPEYSTSPKDPVVTVSGSQSIILSREGKNFQNDTINSKKYAAVPETDGGYRPLLAKEKSKLRNAADTLEAGFMFLAPQDNMGDVEVVFKYKVDTEDAANPANCHTDYPTISRKWSEFASALTKIEAGKAYKLNILIGMNDVNITASETEWVDATTHRIDVPANE